MASAAAVSFSFFEQALSAVSNGAVLAPIFTFIGAGSISSLLSLRPGLRASPMAAADVQWVSKTLAAASASGSVVFPGKYKAAWTDDATHVLHLEAIIRRAIALEPSETAAVAASLVPAAVPAAPAAVSAKKTNAKTAVELFTKAAAVHGMVVPAHARAAYDLVAEHHSGAQDQAPAVTPLGDYHLQLRVHSGKKDEYEHLGEKYVRSEATAKTVDIKAQADLLEQMELRRQVDVVAGCFDVAAACKASGISMPTGDQILPASVKAYVETSASGKAVANSMNCYATPQGQELQITAMRAFLRRNPHASIHKVATVLDPAVQQRIADLKMEGYTGDAAVFQACSKSPELYAASLVESGGKDIMSTPTKGGEGGGKKRSADRTAEERAEAAERQLANKEAQIRNLKGSKGGKGNWQGKGGGGGWGGKGGYNSGYQGWQQPYNGGAGNGPPQNGGNRVQCPQDVCRDFNFKRQGCSAPNCRFKHTCAQCGENHSWASRHANGN